jgi:hypothetical protein
MDVSTVACDICKHQKQETNHWLVVIEKPGFEGLIFLPSEAAQEPRVEGYIYRDLCGHMCAQKKLSQWLDELKNINYPTKGDAA